MFSNIGFEYNYQRRGVPLFRRVEAKSDISLPVSGIQIPTLDLNETNNNINKLPVNQFSKIIEDKVLKLEEQLLSIKKTNEDFQTEVTEKVLNKKKNTKSKAKKEKVNKNKEDKLSYY